MAYKSEAVLVVIRAIMRGLTVQNETFSVDSEKVVHWTDIGGEVLIQGYDSFDLASFFVDMLGSTRPELSLAAANEALDGTAPDFDRPEVIHHSDPHEIFEEPSTPIGPPVRVSDSTPPTLRNHSTQ